MGKTPTLIRRSLSEERTDTMKTSRLSIAAAVLALSLVSSANAADVKFVNIATASTSGSYYPAGLAISKLINDNLKIRASAQSSAGSVENVSLLQNREANLAIIQNNVVNDAMEGKGTFAGKAYKDMSVLCRCSPNGPYRHPRRGRHLLAQGYQGKRWAVGRRAAAPFCRTRPCCRGPT
jgi:ABC-type phosphate/phosphonate transport system substrate-binding protein